MLYSDGGLTEGMIPGMDSGMSDTIMGNVVDGGGPVALSSGEFVMPADVVSMLGDGNSEAGGQALYDLMARVRKMKTGSQGQAPPIDLNRTLPR